MGRHHRLEALLDQALEGDQILRREGGPVSIIRGQLAVRVGLHPTVAREVLAHRCHTGPPCPFDPGRGEGDDLVDRGPETPVTDHPAVPPVQVQYRGEAEVYSGGPQLRGHQPGDGCTSAPCLLGIASVQGSEAAGRGESREPLAEALDPPPLLIHPNQEARLPQPMDRPGELEQLRRGDKVAGEQDDPANGRVTQQLAILGGQLGAAQIHHHGAKGHDQTPRRCGSDPRVVSVSMRMIPLQTSSRPRWAHACFLAHWMGTVAPSRGLCSDPDARHKHARTGSSGLRATHVQAVPEGIPEQIHRQHDGDDREPRGHHEVRRDQHVGHPVPDQAAPGGIGWLDPESQEG